MISFLGFFRSFAALLGASQVASTCKTKPQTHGKDTSQRVTAQSEERFKLCVSVCFSSEHGSTSLCSFWFTGAVLPEPVPATNLGCGGGRAIGLERQPGVLETLSAVPPSGTGHPTTHLPLLAVVLSCHGMAVSFSSRWLHISICRPKGEQTERCTD